MLQLLSEHSRSSFIVYLYLTSTFYFVISQLFQQLLLPTFILVVVVDFLLLRMHTTRTHTLYSRTISGIWVCTQTHPPPNTNTHKDELTHSLWKLTSQTKLNRLNPFAAATFLWRKKKVKFSAYWWWRGVEWGGRSLRTGQRETTASRQTML